MFSQILVAIDGSDYSRQTIPMTIELARKFQSQVFVLHVAEHDRGRASVYSLESPAEATRLVADAVKAMHDAGISARGEVHDVGAGHVAKDIVDSAAAERSEMIVMGSRGLSDVQGLLLGSVTHKVMQLSQVPVLVARGPLPVKADEPKPATVLASA